jgi:hypothetical protein
MAAFILWLLAGIALGYSLWARHLVQYLANTLLFALCVGWVITGVGLVAKRASRAESRVPTGTLSPEDINRLVKKAREQEAAQRAQP